MLMCTPQLPARTQIDKCIPPRVTSLVWHSDAEIAFYGRLEMEERLNLIKNPEKLKRATFLVEEALKGLPEGTKNLEMTITTVNFFSNNSELIGGRYENGILIFEPVVRNSCVSKQEVLSYMRLPYIFQIALIFADINLMIEILFKNRLFLWIAGAFLLFLIIKRKQGKKAN